MKSFQGKSGLLVIACLTVFVIAGSLLLKKTVTTPKAPVAKAGTQGVQKSGEEATKTMSVNQRTATKFVALVVDPYSRPMPGDESVREQIPNGLSLNGIEGGPTRSVPTAGPTRLDLGPLQIQPPPLAGSLPDTATPNSGDQSHPAQGSGATAESDPVQIPVRISIRGVVGTNANRAFISVGGGSPRAARAGTDLGDGITVLRVSEQGVVVRRGSQTKTIPVGKEIEL